MILLLGNPAPIRTFRHPETDELVSEPLTVTESVTVVQIPHDSVKAALAEVADLLKYHVAEGSAPSWVASDDPTLEDSLARELGCKRKSLAAAMREARKHHANLPAVPLAALAEK